jgi:hypothetical protein
LNKETKLIQLETTHKKTSRRPKSRWEDDVRNDYGQNKSKIALSGRILLRRPRLYQSCSSIEEEEEEEEEEDEDEDEDEE